MAARQPVRGSIWFVKIQADPPAKNLRPVIVISPDARNTHPRADTVVVVPLSTSVHKGDVPWHLTLEPGVTGLSERVIAMAEDITTVRKEALQEPRQATRIQSASTVAELIRMVNLALGSLK